MPKENFILENWCKIATACMGCVIMFLLHDKTGAIRLNTTAVQQLSAIVSELSTNVALNTRSSVVNTTALSDLQIRVRQLEVK